MTDKGFSRFLKVPGANGRTPQGVAMWAKIFTPDTGLDDNGNYTIDVEFEETDPEWVQMLDQWQQVLDEFFDTVSANNPDLEKKRLPIKTAKDKDGNYKQGVKVVRFRKPADLKKGKPLPGVAAFDANLNPIVGVNIGNGSAVKVGYILKGYKFGNSIGLSLYPKGVQVLDLHEYQDAGDAGSDAAEAMFEKEQGYKGTAAPAASTDPPGDW